MQLEENYVFGYVGKGEKVHIFYKTSDEISLLF